MMNKNNDKKNFLYYSLFFACLIFVLLIIFFLNDKSFVWINKSNDGLDQHLVNLHLLKRTLLDFFTTGSLNTFFWQIGYGMDMFSNFAYYVFGDFLSYLVVFVPDDLIDSFYNFLVIARLYLIGISFIIYCNHRKLNSFSSLIGAIIYTFSNFALFSVARHPYFTNALIIFPIVLMYTEKIIKEDKKIAFTIAVALLFITSFYFGYMIAIVVMIYGIIFAFCEYKKNYSLIIKKLFVTFLCAVIGLLISSIVLVPTLLGFINSTRTNSQMYAYSLNYYCKLIPSLVSIENVGNWSLIGVSSIFLALMPSFVKVRKKYKEIYITLICLIIPILIPIFGSLLAGFSFPNNRWSFIIAFFSALIVSLMMNNKEKIAFKKTIIFGIIYLVLIILIYNKVNIQMIISFGTGLMFCYIFKYHCANKNKFNFLISFVLFINLAFNIFYLYSDVGFSYVNEFVKTDTNRLYNDSNGQIPYLNDAATYLKEIDNSYYNVLVYPDNLYNLSLMNDYNSISYFYSIVDKNYLAIANELENYELAINKEIKNFNYRTYITTLLNNKYIITTNKNIVPYGYNLIKSFGDTTHIYMNGYYTTFANLYSSKINADKFNGLSPLEKEIYMLNSTVLDEKEYSDVHLKEINKFNTGIDKVNYEVVNNTFGDNLVINKDNNKFILNVENVENKELYLYIKNVKYRSFKLTGDSFSVTVSVDGRTYTEKRHDSLTSPYYFENNDILINLGYYKDFSGEIEITFNSKGTYNFDSLEMLSIDFNNYEKTINDLKKSNFIVEEYKNNYLRGTVNTEEKGILQFTTNYSDAWKIYIDGEMVNSLISNKYFLGVEIDEGFHKIELRYETPGMSAGKYICCLGLVLLVFLIVYEKRKNKRILTIC